MQIRLPSYTAQATRSRATKKKKIASLDKFQASAYSQPFLAEKIITKPNLVDLGYPKKNNKKNNPDLIIEKRLKIHKPNIYCAIPRDTKYYQGKGKRTPKPN